MIKKAGSFTGISLKGMIRNPYKHLAYLPR